jgi:hypothetical protein
MTQVPAHRRRDVRRRPIGVHVHDLDVCQLRCPLGERGEQHLWGGRGAVDEHALARTDLLYGFVRTDFLRIFRTTSTHSSDTSVGWFPS